MDAMQASRYRRQAEQHLEGLRLKSADLGEMVERVAGSLLSDQAETDQQAAELQAVLDASNE